MFTFETVHLMYMHYTFTLKLSAVTPLAIIKGNNLCFGVMLTKSPQHF